MRVQTVIKCLLPLFVLSSNGVLSVSNSGHRPLQPSDFFSRQNSDLFSSRDRDRNYERVLPLDSDGFSDYSEPKYRRRPVEIPIGHPLHQVEESVRFVDDKLRAVDRAIRKWDDDLVDSFDKFMYNTNIIENIGPFMSSYLKGHEKELLSMFKRSKSCERMIGKYINRCKQGDCYTLDNVNMFAAGDRMNIFLPPLCQLNFAIELFKRSGAYDKPGEPVGGLKGLLDFALDRVLSNQTLQMFSDQVLKTNLGNIYFMSRNEEVMNKFMYASTLFYKTYISESFVAPTLNEYLVLKKVFTTRTKSHVIAIADGLFKTNRVSFGRDELDTVTESYIRYLSTDGELYENLVVYFAKLCRDVLLSASKGDRVALALSAYLKNHSIVEKICNKNNIECEEAVGNYIQRCKAGDCYSFDNVKIYTETPQLAISLPDLNQVDAALFTFRHSKAQGYRILNLIKRIFRCNPHKTLRRFIKVLATYNTEKMHFANDTQAFLNGFLYESALFYRRFLYISYFKRFYNLNKFTLSIFRFVKIRRMRKMAEALSKKKIIVVPDVFNSIFNEFNAYLFVRKAIKYKRLTNFYVHLCKEAAGVALEGDNITISMADYLANHSIEWKVCSVGNEECKADVEKYVQRCKIGDCYTLDNIKIYDEVPKLAIFLPNLNQVDAALYVYKHCSRDYIDNIDRTLSFVLGEVSEKTLRFTRLLLSINFKKLNTNSFTHKVVNNFLYHATIYYKSAVARRHISTGLTDSGYLDKPIPMSDMENHLNKALNNIASAGNIVIEKDHLINILKKYRNYLIKSLAPGNDQRLRDFSYACYNVIKQYINTHNEKA